MILEYTLESPRTGRISQLRYLDSRSMLAAGSPVSTLRAGPSRPALSLRMSRAFRWASYAADGLDSVEVDDVGDGQGDGSRGQPSAMLVVSVDSAVRLKLGVGRHTRHLVRAAADVLRLEHVAELLRVESKGAGVDREAGLVVIRVQAVGHLLESDARKASEAVAVPLSSRRTPRKRLRKRFEGAKGLEGIQLSQGLMAQDARGVALEQSRQRLRAHNNTARAAAGEDLGVAHAVS